MLARKNSPSSTHSYIQSSVMTMPVKSPLCDNNIFSRGCPPVCMLPYEIFDVAAD